MLTRERAVAAQNEAVEIQARIAALEGELGDLDSRKRTDRGIADAIRSARLAVDHLLERLRAVVDDLDSGPSR